MLRSMIQTVDELIKALGGTGAVCRARAVGKTAVSNWRVTNVLPQRHHYWAAKECEARGIEVSETLFETSGAAGEAA